MGVSPARDAKILRANHAIGNYENACLANQEVGLLLTRLDGIIAVNVAAGALESAKYWQYWRDRVAKNEFVLTVLQKVVRAERIIAIRTRLGQPPARVDGFVFAEWLKREEKRLADRRAKRPDWMNDPSKLPKKPPIAKKDEDE